MIRTRVFLAAVAALSASASAWGWGFIKGDVKDPALPKVLLIGDSILGGYRFTVVNRLEGKATVDAYGNPYNQANNNWHSELKSLLSSNGPYAVIHFNLGLHGWRTNDIPHGQFEPLTTRCVETLRENAPGARIIWASTTPVTTTNRPFALHPLINPVIVEHNAMAAAVMKRLDIPINDLYALVLPHLDLMHGDQFHWQGKGYELMGEAVARSIEAQLESLKTEPERK